MTHERLRLSKGFQRESGLGFGSGVALQTVLLQESPPLRTKVWHRLGAEGGMAEQQNSNHSSHHELPECEETTGNRAPEIENFAQLHCTPKGRSTEMNSALDVLSMGSQWH